MEIYLVGGAIRDQILGIASETTEKDYVVIGSSPEELLSLGYRQVGKEFPVFLHPESHDEYALARIERKVGAGYTGFEFDTSKTVTLEQDLSRRDLTVNAIAQKIDGNGSYVDPYGGIEDIKKKTLRYVSDAFSEDPVRILRTARFASRFSNLGFTIDDKTLQLIKLMVVSGEVDALTPERVFKEIILSMETESPAVFFEVLIESGAYERLFPMLELSNNIDFTILNKSIELPEVTIAIWLHKQNLQNIEALCNHLKCPKDIQQIAELTSEWHHFAMNFLSFNPQEVLNFYLKNDGLRRHRRFQIILTVFDCLGINTKPIIELLGILKSIQISKLANINIAEEIVQERLSIITQFLDSTK